MKAVPKELDIWGVYMPPSLFVILLGAGCAMLTAYWLNRFRLSRFVAMPQLVFLDMVLIYSCLISWFVIPA